MVNERDQRERMVGRRFDTFCGLLENAPGHEAAQLRTDFCQRLGVVPFMGRVVKREERKKVAEVEEKRSTKIRLIRRFKKHHRVLSDGEIEEGLWR